MTHPKIIGVDELINAHHLDSPADGWSGFDPICSSRQAPLSKQRGPCEFKNRVANDFVRNPISIY
jgi:hypothetical protein